MNLYTTLIRATDPLDGELKTWMGPYVPGISFSDAESYCQNNGLGYCKVDAQYLGEIPDNFERNSPEDIFKAASKAGIFDNYKKGLN